MSIHGVPHARSPHLPILMLIHARRSISAANARLDTDAVLPPYPPSPTQQPLASEVRASLGALNHSPPTPGSSPASLPARPSSISAPAGLQQGTTESPVQEMGHQLDQMPAGPRQATTEQATIPQPYQVPAGPQQATTEQATIPQLYQVPAGPQQATTHVQGKGHQLGHMTAERQQDASAMHLTWLPALGLAAAALHELLTQLSTHSTRSMEVQAWQVAGAYCHSALLVCELEATERAGRTFEAGTGDVTTEGLPGHGFDSSRSAGNANLQQEERQQLLKSDRAPAQWAAAEFNNGQWDQQRRVSTGVLPEAEAVIQRWRQQQGTSSRLVQDLRGQVEELTLQLGLHLFDRLPASSGYASLQMDSPVAEGAAMAAAAWLEDMLHTLASQGFSKEADAAIQRVAIKHGKARTQPVHHHHQQQQQQQQQQQRRQRRQGAQLAGSNQKQFQLQLQQQQKQSKSEPVLTTTEKPGRQSEVHSSNSSNSSTSSTGLLLPQLLDRLLLCLLPLCSPQPLPHIPSPASKPHTSKVRASSIKTVSHARAPAAQTHVHSSADDLRLSERLHSINLSRLLRSLDIMQLHLPPVWHRAAISVLSRELTSCSPSESSSATAAATPPSTAQHAATYPREALRTGTSLEPNESNSARAVTSSAAQHSTTDPHAAVKAASPAVSSSSSCMAWASSSLAHLVRVAAATHQHQHHRGHHNEEEDAVLTLSVVHWY
ncbi:hypothetical protein DUNSADRAFT_3162, partial [Dunaliella salina]